MIALLLLWILATVDAAFIGYREAAGRSALVDKRSYFRRAMLRGAVLGQAAVVAVGVAAIVMLVLSSDRSLLIAQYEMAASRMLTVFLPYAAILLITFLVRLVPSVDVRSITSVLIFGPFTLIRPLVVVAGVLWGLLYAPNWITLELCTLILLLMLGLELFIGKLRPVSPIS